MQQLARQAQKLQQQMTEMQATLDEREFEASAGGGMVTIRHGKFDKARALLKEAGMPEGTTFTLRLPLA